MSNGLYLAFRRHWLERLRGARRARKSWRHIAYCRAQLAQLRCMRKQ